MNITYMGQEYQVEKFHPGANDGAQVRCKLIDGDPVGLVEWFVREYGQLPERIWYSGDFGETFLMFPVPGNWQQGQLEISIPEAMPIWPSGWDDVANDSVWDDEWPDPLPLGVE